MLTFGDPNRAFKNFYENILTVLQVNYCFWPFINFLNFKYIPEKYRILAVNSCALLWNAFLARINQKSVEKSQKIDE